MRPVGGDEIESLAIGAWILGTGGGGSPYLALLNMRQLYRKGVVCRLMAAAELADDDLVAVVSNMGAPLVGQERVRGNDGVVAGTTLTSASADFEASIFRAVSRKAISFCCRSASAIFSNRSSGT